MALFIFIGESLGWQEIILIGTLALIFFGPKRLPELARKVGKTIADLKKAGQEFRRAWEQEIELEEREREFFKKAFDENLIIAEEKYAVKFEDKAQSQGIDKSLAPRSASGPEFTSDKTFNNSAESDMRLEDNSELKSNVQLENRKQYWL